MGSPADRRLKTYSKPNSPENWCGASTKEYIREWSDRASANSQLAPRAKTEMELPSTETRTAPERQGYISDPHAEGRRRHSHVVSGGGAGDYMPKARRIT